MQALECLIMSYFSFAMYKAIIKVSDFGSKCLRKVLYYTYSWTSQDVFLVFFLL